VPPVAVASPGTAAPTRVNLFQEVGRSGTRIFSGLVQEEFVRDLVGLRGVQAFKEMSSNSPVVGGCLLAIKLPIRTARWYVEPAGKEPEDLLAAEFCESLLEDMEDSIEAVVSEMLSFVEYGWSFCELVYKRRRGDRAAEGVRSKFEDGRIGWRRIPLRAQHSLESWQQAKDTDDIEGLWQIPAPDFQRRFVPTQKAVHLRVGATRGNPEGVSLLRSGWFAWYFVKELCKIEAIGVERDLSGLPVAGVPPDYLFENAPLEKQAVVTALRKILQTIRVDENASIIKPLAYDKDGNPTFTLELMSSPGTRSHDTTKIIERHEIRIAQALLTDFIMIGHSAVGSRALAEPKMDFFMLALNALADVIASGFSRQAFPRVLALNGMDPRRSPTLQHGELRSPDLTEIGNYIKTLSDAGMPMFPDSQLEQHLREIGGLPAAVESGLIGEEDERTRTEPPDPDAGAADDAAVDDEGNPKKKPAPTAKPNGKDPGVSTAAKALLNVLQVVLRRSDVRELADDLGKIR
jgi:hypothetical protein